ncbi:hypothetical protein JTE90_011498 [Oedothorax gibbosus]|uniref:Tubulin-specific chaperone E n=1 Tax=Oedothorax gibbosus TaxID=931172 RepID=A0AAV6VDC2_9ARAC|nr:hypothetical protein JTE90_011498 [Oedothorax gibbosus]
MGAPFIEVGSRIHCDSAYGQVSYVGPIDGMEGIWLGIEWDDPNRGKHSGCYNNKTYFNTRIPDSGSFIRITKADVGISCPDAIKIKYGKEKDSSEVPNFVNFPQKSGASRHIEMVGMEKIKGKQSNFVRLTDVVLYGMLISSPGELNELSEMVPNVKDLDLSQNLLSTWNDVAEITKQLPFLSSLILSRNRLQIPEEGDKYQELFKTLKMLVLNNMSYSWKEILCCATMWPHIEMLSVLDNGISSLEQPPSPLFSNLKVLSLDNNPICTWKEINKLGTLTNLEELHADNTSLESIEFPETSPVEKTLLFPSLETLYIRNNKLNCWKSIGELNKLKSLKVLMISNNPIVQSVNLETARQLIIAKIQGLEKLNRTEVERAERRGAETDYLKRYRNEWVASGGSMTSQPSEVFIAEHPTYLPLVQKHGAADENEVKVQSTLIKDNLICVKIFSPLTPEKPALTRKLPAEMTVGKLKALVQRIFKVQSNEVTLTCIFKEDDTTRTEMDNNMRQLSFYSISDQDTICVEW